MHQGTRIGRTDSDYLAARLALLLMRAGLQEAAAGNATIAKDSVRLQPGSNDLPLDAAASRLSTWTKPVACDAALNAGRMEVTVRAMTPDEERTRRFSVDYWESQGGWIPHLRRQVGDDLYDRAAIYCTGFDEALLVQVADFERMERDYRVSPAGYAGSPPSFFLARMPAAAREAHAAGAAYSSNATAAENSSSPSGRGE